MTRTPTPARSDREQRVRDELLAAALGHADRGQPVFPAYSFDVVQDDGRTSKAKAPMLPNGLYGASTDAERITTWWTRWPLAAIGLPTGLCHDVLDVDCKPGRPNGYRELKQLDADLHLLDTAVAAVRTPSGGLHLYYPADPDRPMANATFAHAGIDLRGRGGYAIAPPSILAEAVDEPADELVDEHARSVRMIGRYELHSSRAAGAPLDHERVRALLEDRREPPFHRHPQSLRGPQGGNRGPRGGCKDLRALVAWLGRQTAVGGRNSALYWAACRAVEQGDDPDALVDTALELGLEPGEVEATIRSARRRGEA